MDYETLVKNHKQVLERMKWQFLNDYATRIDARHSFAALASGFEPDITQAYRAYNGYKYDNGFTNKRSEAFDVAELIRPVDASVEMAPFVYEVYKAGSTSKHLSEIAQKHSEEMQERFHGTPSKRYMRANMIALVEAMAEKEGRSATEVYKKLDAAFSKREAPYWKTSLPKDHLDAFHLPGRYLGAEKLPTKSLQDVCDILYTKPSIADKAEKVKALRVCAKKYLANPRTNEEYLVVLADCKQDIRRLIDTKISKNCFDVIKDISPDMAQELKVGGFVGKWESSEELYVPVSRFDAGYIEQAKDSLVSIDSYSAPFISWKDKFMALSPNSSEDEFKEFQEETERFVESESDSRVRRTVSLCAEVVSAYARKDFGRVSQLAEIMTARIHTRREECIGSDYSYVTEEEWSEDGEFYETSFGRDAAEAGREYLAEKVALDKEPKLRAERLRAEAEARARLAAETEAKAQEDNRRAKALESIGAFQSDMSEDKDIEPISVA